MNNKSDNAEKLVYLTAQIRAQQAISALRNGARKAGIQRLTCEEIEIEIQCTRDLRHV